MVQKKGQHRKGQKPRRTKKRAGRRVRRSGAGSRTKIALLILLSAALASAIAGIHYYAKFTRLIDARLKIYRPAETAVLARDGTFLSNLYDQRRQRTRPVEFDRLPSHLIDAVLAAEDEGFFFHRGLDLRSMLRATLTNLIEWAPVQGGSTLTQQFIKNYFLTPEKTVSRKLEEVFFALLLERHFSKQEIFEFYANSVYLGQYGSFAVVGFGEAADLLFDKDVGELTLPESALLAGLIQAPNRYAPLRNPDNAIARRNYVLRLMDEKGFIDTRRRAGAQQEPLGVRRPGPSAFVGSSYFLDYVRAELRDRRVEWESSESFQVKTTLDVALQQAAGEAVTAGLQEVDRLLSERRSERKPEVALVALAPQTGEILAMVGGRSYPKSQFNRAVNAFRQPGSAFKPFVYAAALEGGSEPDVPYTLAGYLIDEPTTFYFNDQVYRPHNSDNRFRGPVTLRQALEESLNVPTVALAEEIGFDSMVRISRRLGFSHQPPPYPSTALGTSEVTLLELVQAYTAFPAGGLMAQARSLLSWRSDEAEVSFSPQRSRVLTPAVSYLVTSALRSAVESGTACEVRARGVALPVAGKTGTTDDSWFVGYTPDLVCGVWVGYDDSSRLGLSGSRAALPIWTAFMKRAQRLGKLQRRGFERPESVVAVEIDARSGFLAGPGCRETRTEYYLAGTEPTAHCRYDGSSVDVVALQAKRREVKKGLIGWLKKIF